jgi:hypothetical protein
LRNKINPKKLSNPEEIIEFIKKLESKVQQPLFDHEKPENIKIKLRVDETISPGRFKADPIIPGGHVANSLTIRAMRTDLFVFGDEFEDLEAIYTCGCGQEIDVQFWKFCPFCASDFKL